jgi:hypothetical protein
MQEMSIVQQATGEFSMASQHRRKARQSNKRLKRAMSRAAPTRKINIVTSLHAA